MSLSPIQQKLLPEIVEDRIVAYIQLENLGVGESLPGEKELAERFQVSRGVIREALSRLRLLGIVDSRRNRGLVVCPPDPLSGFAKVVTSPLLGRQYERDLLELRVIHELGIADLFWDRKRPEDLVEFRALAEQLDTHPDYPSVTENNRHLEIAFHGKLFEVVGNHLVTRMRSLLTLFYGLDKLHRRTPPLKRPSLPNHRDLVSIMATGTRMEFREAIYEHLRVYLDLLNLERTTDPDEANLDSAIDGLVSPTRS